jgi:hypothetical protein
VGSMVCHSVAVPTLTGIVNPATSAFQRYGHCSGGRVELQFQRRQRQEPQV